DGRTVEHDVAAKRLLELRTRHLHVLVDAEDVGELQSQEADVAVAHEREHVAHSRIREVGRERWRRSHAGIIRSRAACCESRATPPGSTTIISRRVPDRCARPAFDATGRTAFPWPTHRPAYRLPPLALLSPEWRQ